MKITLGLATVAAALLLAPASTTLAQGRAHRARPGEVILKFRTYAPAHERDAILADLGATEVRDLVGSSTKHARIHKLGVDEAIARYRNHPLVEFIEPNYILEASREPNDPRFLEQWALRNTGQTGGLPGADTKATVAWETFTGSPSVLVAIVDTGIDFSHPDLSTNIYVNPGEIPGNGIDDDGNGYIDDVHGWDFVSNDNNPLDDHGHGTHVSGIIGAVGDNAVGVTGLNWRIQLLPVKFLDAFGSGSTAGAVSSIQYAVAMGARAINASWGGGGPSEALRLAIVAADAAGVLFVAAAGNSGNDNDLFPDYPSCYDIPNIISVAASDHTDLLAPWSNYGAVSVDLAAPGVNILSTLPSSYGSMSGTSMAAPYVTGAVGLVFGRFPSIAAADAKNLILSSVDAIPAFAGRVATGGRLNAWLPIAEPDSIPPTPIGDLIAMDANGTRITLRWTATGDDGTSGTASHYEVRYLTSPINEANFDAATLASGAPRPQPSGSPEEMQVQGLQFLTTYFFAVKAFDEFGNASPVSNLASATTLGPPHLSVVPTSLAAALLTGQTTTQVLTLANTGVSELNFDLRVEPVAGVVGVQLHPRRHRESQIRSAAAQDALASPYPPTQEAYDGGRAAPRARLQPGSIRTLDLNSGRLRLLVLQSGGDVSEIQTLLASFPDVEVVDVFDGGATAPTLGNLIAYDAVLIANNRAFGDPVGVGNVVADYVDRGGGVVLTLASFISGWELQGRFLSEGYSPFSVGSGPIGSSSLGSFDATHPIMAGVTSATGDLLGDTSVSGGSELIASWVNGEPLVATKSTSVAAVNVFVGAPGYWTGDIPLVLHNAAFWSSGAVSWLSMDPTSGVVPASQQVDVIVTFDASRLDGGDYRAQIAVRNDDPSNSDLAIPVRLQVTGAPNIAVTAEDVVEESAVDYSVDGARTVHILPIAVPAGGGGSLELLAEGDYGASSETATLTAEGITLGSVGGVGTDCSPAERSFPLTAAQLGALIADGRVDAEVQNSIDVNVFCVPNRHTVRLRYAPPADRLEFGAVFVGGAKELTLNVINSGSDVLEVSSIRADIGEFVPDAPSMTLAPRTSEILAVTFRPSGVRSFTGTLTVQSNDPDAPTVTMALSGTGVTPPVIGVQPPALSSTLDEGDQETQILTISNSGRSDLDFKLRIRPPLHGGALSPFAGLSPSLPGTSDNPSQQLPPPAQGQDTAFGLEPRFVAASAEFELLRASPVPLTCVVEEPLTDALLAQENYGVRFYRYLASTNTWAPLANAPISSGNNGGAALLNGKVYTTYTTDGSLLGVYDIASNSWSTRPHPLGAGTGNIASDGVQFLYFALGFQLLRFDPASGTTMMLSSPPMYFEPWGGLRHLDGVLYGHQGNGSTGFAKYDIAANVWTPLPSVPGGAVLGATIDPIAGEYVTYGPYGGTNLYRYAIRDGSWTVNTIPFFAVGDGGLGWLGGTIPGVYFVEGESGTGLARVISLPEFLTVAPTAGRVPALGSLDVSVLFDTGTLFGGTYGAEIVVRSNDPVDSLVVVPASLTVRANPNIEVAGGLVSVESVVDYTTTGAITVHVLPAKVPPAAGGTLELVADGDYADTSETATLTVEGTSLGSVGGVGTDCIPASGSFPVGAATLTALLADGRVDATVQNSINVDLFCISNRHTVRLKYDTPADRLDFGSLFVGLTRDLTLRIFNRGSANLEVTSITTDLPEFTPAFAALTVGPRSMKSLTVTFHPASPGVRTGTLTLTSNDPDEPQITVSLQGEGLIPPEIVVTPTTVSANLFTGGRTQKTVTIANIGGSDLEFAIETRGVRVTRAKVVPAPRRGSGTALSRGTVTEKPAGLPQGAAEMRAEAAQRPVMVTEEPTEPLSSRQAPSHYALQPLGFSTMAGATTLVIQDVAPWGTMSNEQVLTANGIAFDMIPSTALAATDLSRYDLVLVPSDQPTSYYSRLAAQQAQLNAYVGSGGVLEFHAAGWGWSGGNASLVTLPEGMGIQPHNADVNNVLDPSHPLVVGVPTPIVGTSASHSYFTGIPASASWIVSDDLGRPNLVVYGSGRGLVIAGCQVFEFGYARGQTTGLILENMIPYAHTPSPKWLSLDPLTGIVPAESSLELTLTFDATGLWGGDYAGMVLVNSNDPDEPTVEVAAQLHVTGAPDVSLLGELEDVQSKQTYLVSGARTTHTLSVTVPSAGGGTLDLLAEGDYGVFEETATVTVEGQRVGEVGRVGTDCTPANGTFEIAAADLARWVADGRVEAEVQNSSAVDVFCAENSHTVRLRYRGPADVVDFGSFFVGLCRNRSLEVANLGTDVLTVSGVTTSSPDVTVDASSFTLSPGESRELVVSFCPVSPGVLVGALTVHSDDPDEPEIKAALQGEGLTPPDIAVAPLVLNEDLLVGETSTKGLRIANSGGSPLTVQLSLRFPAGLAAPATTRPAASAREGEAPTRLGNDPAFYREMYGAFTAPGGVGASAPLAEGVREKGGRSGARLNETVIFFDDMESGPNGWSHSSTHPSGVDLWQQSTVRASSGSTSWNVAQHASQGGDALQSPPISLMGYGQAALSFKHFYQFDDCGGDPAFEPDGGIVEVSTDGGIVWQQVFPDGGYPFTLDDICSNPLASYQAYSHSSGGAFVPAVFDLSPFVENTILIRFHAGWDCGNCQVNEGWYVDDVSVTSETPRWVSVSPVEATIGPQQVVEVQVGFDATTLSVGSYDAELVIASNDPDEPSLVIPVNLQLWDVGVGLESVPNTVNLGRNGLWVMGKLAFPPDIDPASVIVSTVYYNRDAPADPHDHEVVPDGGLKLYLKFETAAVRPTLSEGDEVPVIVTGQTASGLRFLGRDRIRVIRHQVTAPNGGEVLAAGGTYRIAWDVPPAWGVTRADVEYSLDGGVSFQNIVTGIVGTSYDWSLPRAATSKAKVRVTLFDDLGMIGRDTSNDVFEIGDTPSTVAQGISGELGLWLQNSPNPFTAGTATKIAFRVPNASPVSLKVYNVAGQLVRTLRDGAMLAGVHAVHWDGLDDGRRQVAAGIYFCRLRIQDASLTRRILLLR